MPGEARPGGESAGGDVGSYGTFLLHSEQEGEQGDEPGAGEGAYGTFVVHGSTLEGGANELGTFAVHGTGSASVV